jgi:hypothetical protein
MRLLFCFQGKGSCLSYDGGVLHEAYARIPAMRQQRVIVAGNSSGSILAAYFGCAGFSDATVRHAEQHVLHGDKTAVRNMENPHSKLAKLLRGRPTEISHLELREYIAFALGVEDWQSARSIEEIVGRSRAECRFPCLIVACNKEVLEDRADDDKTEARGEKELNYSNLSVSWRPEVYDFYRRHPDRFARDHPDLKLGEDRRIGKAATFFVDRSLYELLRQIPPEERTADLRLMSTAEDVALAILASVSEPTYFDAVPEPQPSKILAGAVAGDLGNVRRRTYYGGYLVPVPAQDVRRMAPGVRVLGTGWRHHSLMTQRIMSAWLLAEIEPLAEQLEWWADLEVNPDLEFQSHMGVRDLTAQQEFDFGRRLARKYFAGQGGLPLFVAPPRFRWAADAAVQPAIEDQDYDRTVTLPNGRHPLKTLRGMGPLVQP